MAEHHVRLAAVHEERAVERHHVLGRGGLARDGTERPRGRGGFVDPRAAPAFEARRVRSARAFAVGVERERGEHQVAGPHLVHLRRPDGAAVVLRRYGHHGLRTRPPEKIFRRAHAHAARVGSASVGVGRLVEVVGLRGAVREDERVADAEGVGRDWRGLSLGGVRADDGAGLEGAGSAYVFGADADGGEQVVGVAGLPVVDDRLARVVERNRLRVPERLRGDVRVRHDAIDLVGGHESAPPRTHKRGFGGRRTRSQSDRRHRCKHPLHS